MAGKYKNEDHLDLLEHIKALENRISRLERTPQLQNAGVSREGITLNGGGITFINEVDSFSNIGGLIAIASRYFVNGEEGMAFVLTRSKSVAGADTFFESDEIITGNTAIIIATHEGPNGAVDGFPTVSIQDKSGNPFLTDTYAARRGMSDPRLQIPWSASALTTSTSGTFAEFSQAEWYTYHPHLRVRLLINNDVGSTGEIQIRDNYNGAQDRVVGFVATTSGQFGYADIIVTRSNYPNTESNGSVVGLSVDLRRASGAGTVRARIVSMVAIDLSWFNPY